MDNRVSNYLDIVRVIASFAVLFQHLSMFNNDIFSGFQNYGHQAVIAFFVLSGYVIAFVANEREKTYRIFLKHRFARIYSVMVVAWLLTALLDSIGPLINAGIYEGTIAADLIIVRIFSHLLFLHESWFVSIQFLGNEPLWSLAYEFYYYIIFGAIFLYHGKYKKTLVIFIALLMGPVILLYGLIWISGGFLYKIHNKKYNPNQIISSIIFIISTLILFLYPYWERLVDFDLFSYQKLNLSTLVKDFSFCFFIGVNIYFFKYSTFSFQLIQPVIRFFSGISFSLYVFHYPLMYFFGALLIEYSTLGNAFMFMIMTITIVYSVYLLSFISERKKRSYLKIFNHLFIYIEKKSSYFQKDRSR